MGNLEGTAGPVTEMNMTIKQYNPMFRVRGLNYAFIPPDDMTMEELIVALKSIDIEVIELT